MVLGVEVFSWEDGELSGNSLKISPNDLTIEIWYWRVMKIVVNLPVFMRLPWTTWRPPPCPIPRETIAWKHYRLQMIYPKLQKKNDIKRPRSHTRGKSDSVSCKRDPVYLVVNVTNLQPPFWDTFKRVHGWLVKSPPGEPVEPEAKRPKVEADEVGNLVHKRLGGP